MDLFLSNKNENMMLKEEYLEEDIEKKLMMKKNNKKEQLVILLNLRQEVDHLKKNKKYLNKYLPKKLNPSRFCKNSFKDKIILIKAFAKNKNNNSLIGKIKIP
jgi:hypothetical protein